MASDSPSVDGAELLLRERFKLSTAGRNIYEEVFSLRMATAPDGIQRFADSRLRDDERAHLLTWLRDLDDRLSMQSLQILFAFSVPNDVALSAIADLQRPVVSMGAGGGYWESLLTARGVCVTAYDANDRYPTVMRYCHIETGGPEMLRSHPRLCVLLLAWPDVDECSSFGVDCVRAFPGDFIAHVGELLGETSSSHPWGQTTSSACQLLLAERFRCIRRVTLPRWPGNWDALSLWQRIGEAVDCNGALLHHVDVNVSARVT